MTHRAHSEPTSLVPSTVGPSVDTSNPSGFATWLSAFYDNLLTVLHAEVWISEPSLVRCIIVIFLSLSLC